MGDDENYGIHWSTEHNFDITAAAENTLIMGESAELVAGASATLEVIGSVDVFLLELLEITLGLRQVLASCKYHFSTEENEVEELHDKVHGKLTEIATGAKMKAVDKEIEAAEEKVSVAGLAWEAHDTKYKATAEKVNLCATKDEVNAEKQGVAAKVNQELGAQSNTLGDKTVVVGMDTQTAAQKTETLASHVKTALEQTKNIAAATHMGAEQTTLSGIINKL